MYTAELVKKKHFWVLANFDEIETFQFPANFTKIAVVSYIVKVQ